MSIEERILKLLNLAKGSTNEHEAAQAAARAAMLMSEHQISEAMLRLADDSKQAEPIVEGRLDGTRVEGKRVAWKFALANGVAASLGCKVYFYGGAAEAFGRESSVQAWNYTCQYLMREVDRLAIERWEAEKSDAQAHGHTKRAWCNAFRVGAATAVSRRLSADARERKYQRSADVVRAACDAGIDTTQALAVIERDEQEVETRYAELSKGFRKGAAIGKVSVRSGYHAGKEAGASIRLGGGRAGLPEGQRSIRSGK